MRLNGHMKNLCLWEPDSENWQMEMKMLICRSMRNIRAKNLCQMKFACNTALHEG